MDGIWRSMLSADNYLAGHCTTCPGWPPTTQQRSDLHAATASSSGPCRWLFA